MRGLVSQPFYIFLSFFFVVPFTMTSKRKESEKRKRTNLSIAAKLELIEKLESGVSVARVCDEYGVKKQTVSDIRRSKEKLQAFAVNFDVDPSTDRKGVVHGRKHMKVSQSRDLEGAVYKWYMQQRAVNVNVRGVEIVEAAKKLAEHMGVTFQGSAGWLWRFGNRHGIRHKNVQGESGSADLHLFTIILIKENLFTYLLQMYCSYYSTVLYVLCGFRPRKNN